MPAHTVTLAHRISESDMDQLKNLITSAGGKITKQEQDRISFNVSDDFDLHLITKYLRDETLSDHP